MSTSPEYDVILRNGTLFDGSGQPPVKGDLALRGESIAALGDLGQAHGRHEMDVSGLAVAGSARTIFRTDRDYFILVGTVPRADRTFLLPGPR